MRNTYPNESEYQYKIIKYQYVVSEQNFCAIDRAESISDYVKKFNFGEIRIDPIEVFTVKTIFHIAPYNSKPIAFP
jgi:hypothetical protein